MSTGKFEAMLEKFFEGLAYGVAACLILMPTGLCLFTVFLMITYPATEEEMIEHGHWLTEDKLDEINKNL